MRGLHTIMGPIFFCVLAGCNSATTDGSENDPTEAATEAAAQAETQAAAASEPTIATATAPALAQQFLVGSGASITNNNDGTFTISTDEGSRTAAPNALSTTNVTLILDSTAGTIGAVIVDNGMVRAGSVASDANIGSGSSEGAFYERLVQTELPLSGAATMTGEYIGVTGAGIGAAANTITNTPKGDVTLNVDFATSKLSGAITNRVSGPSFTDVTFAETTLNNDGSFSGTATGGEFDPNIIATNQAGTGTFAGVVGGPTGNQAAGVVALRYRSGGLQYRETGAFYADK